MKNAILKSRNISIALFMLLATTSAALANNDKNKEKNSEATAVEFRFVGKMERQPVYQLDINKTEEEGYSISFTDNSGITLYSGIIKSGTSSQKFLINADEVGDEPLTVTITSRKTNRSYIYTIRRSQSLVEENIVKKIN